MSVKRELADSLKRVVELEKELFLKAPTLTEQATILENELRENHAFIAGDLNILARLCLLSEIYGALDFDRMVEARERFQGAFPEHFAEYLANVEAIGWQIIWPGCLECANFDGSCLLGLMPMESLNGRSRFDRCCTAKKPRAGKE